MPSVTVQTRQVVCVSCSLLNCSPEHSRCYDDIVLDTLILAEAGGMVPPICTKILARTQFVQEHVSRVIVARLPSISDRDAFGVFDREVAVVARTAHGLLSFVVHLECVHGVPDVHGRIAGCPQGGLIYAEICAEMQYTMSLVVKMVTPAEPYPNNVCYGP